MSLRKAVKDVLDLHDDIFHNRGKDAEIIAALRTAYAEPYVPFSDEEYNLLGLAYEKLPYGHKTPFARYVEQATAARFGIEVGK